MEKDYYNADLAELLGKTLSKVRRGMDEVVGGDFIEFVSTTGEYWLMYYEPDCCASCDIEDVVGDLQDLVGSPISMAEVSTNSEGEGKDKYDSSFTWTFYRLATAKGYVTIRWYGSSNGYYSETACFRRLYQRNN